jgi:hypothetical protein
LVYEKKLHCPTCNSQETIRKGIRRGKLKFLCKSCHHWFQLNRSPQPTSALKLTLQHLNGHSYRTIASQEGRHHSTIYRKVAPILKRLPHCADVTRKFCARFCGILLVDGKYVTVKGYEKKIPVVYGIDYLTHDIPTYLLSRGENYQTCHAFFTSLRLLNYPLTTLVCDDNINIYQACKQIYPRATVQLCLNHFKENLRRRLEVRSNPTYAPFMHSLETLFDRKLNLTDFNRRARGITKNYYPNRLCMEIMLEIERKKPYLLGYLGSKGVPTTTNLIECYNSHLQGRLKTIKGFESFQHADTWLNGYFLKRRTRKLTDCAGKFKHLNGKTSLEKSKKRGIDIPDFFE